MDSASMVNTVAHARDIAARAAARVEAEIAKKTKARQPNRIYEGDTVICETSDGRIFFQEVKGSCTIRVGKKLTPLKPVIGAFYGSIFEEQNKKLVPVSGGLFPDPVAPETGEFEVPDTDNRNYTDTNSAQKLSVHDITGMRESGASGREIIQKLVENSETWDAKTEFSKQKYLKKKQQKYMPRVRFLKCTAESLCRTYRAKNPSKICNIREDSLGQILMYANIHAEAQVLVVDTCMGLVTGAIVERQAGLGRIIAGFEGQQLSADILRRFNFDKSTMESIHTFPLNSVQYLEMLQQMDSVIDVQLSETWTREHQILPGRTHPEMKMNAFSGYLLTGTKVLHVDAATLRRLDSKSTVRKPAADDDDSAVVEPAAKRVKTEQASSDSNEN
ncbi:hypothetical protein P43SY_009222 [Pythium insidiosum]|uniref:tRNA (adenine(58)-N(1))-methyltransferase non-catalytic subunit TRM6 n=1 Tax=Pythium insidiosum TaxID=114742 RepID=A0AAD5QBM8_PYTIN|nr:hypothetical protein P43SY_009222 [Pythium insidiosum]